MLVNRRRGRAGRVVPEPIIHDAETKPRPRIVPPHVIDGEVLRRQDAGRIDALELHTAPALAQQPLIAAAKTGRHDDRVHQTVERVGHAGAVPLHRDDRRVGVRVGAHHLLRAQQLQRREVNQRPADERIQILNSYKGFAIQPEFETTDNAFKITLPNQNEQLQDSGLSSDEKRIIDLAVRLGEIKRKDVETEMGISQTMAGRILKSMVNKQLIEATGQGRKTMYVLKR